MKNSDRAIIYSLLFTIVILLYFSFMSFVAAKYQIGKINRSQLEQCYLLDCDISPMGDVRCTSVIADDFMDIPKDFVRLPFNET